MANLEEFLNRKVNHALLERKRRVRCNDLFKRLKDIVPGCNDRLSLCKNDILELTVKYIETIQDQIGTDVQVAAESASAKREYSQLQTPDSASSGYQSPMSLPNLVDSLELPPFQLPAARSTASDSFSRMNVARLLNQEKVIH